MTKELLEYLTPWLVDEPDAVEVKEIEGDRGATVLEVSVAPADIGKLIGKRGRIIRAIRTVARAAGQRDDRTVLVEVVD